MGPGHARARGQRVRGRARVRASSAHRPLAHGVLRQDPYKCDEGEAPRGARCMYFNQNPGSDMMSFDSVAVALLVLLQAITFDDWCSPMYALMDSFSP